MYLYTKQLLQQRAVAFNFIHLLLATQKDLEKIILLYSSTVQTMVEIYIVVFLVHAVNLTLYGIVLPLALRQKPPFLDLTPPL